MAVSDDENELPAEPLSIRDLAAMVVDALLRAQLVDPADVERAIAVTAEELLVRQVFGDLRVGLD